MPAILEPYKPAYNVSKDAVARARTLTTIRTDAQPDNAVREFIDKAVKEAVGEGKYEPILDAVAEGAISEALLVTLPRRVGKGLFAVVKDDKFAYQKKGGPTQIVMTILDDQTVTYNLHNNKWRHKSQPGEPMVSLGAKLPKGLMAASLSKPQEVKGTPPSPVGDLGQATPILHWKIQYPGHDDAPVEEVFESKETCLAAVEELANEGGLADVKVWKEVLRPIWEEVKPKAKVEL